MRIILESIGIGTLGLLGFVVMFAIASAFERLKRIEVTVDGIKERLDTSKEKGKDEAE